MTEVGLRLPTLESQGPTGPRLRELAQRAEALGFDALWLVDHLLAAEYVFGAASWDPLELLPYLAGCTEEIGLGVSVLIAPLRHRIWLLKQLGTLSRLAGDRILLGLGVGWDEREFAASGVRRSTRGRLLDELLEALAAARRDGALTVDGVPIEPPPDRWRAILPGGGSSLTVLEDGRPAQLSERVLDRIARADGWVVRSSSPPDMMRRDLEQIRVRRGQLRVDGPFTVARAMFVHVSLEAERQRALDEQLAAMRGIGFAGSREQLSAQYPSGTVDEVVEWMSASAETGADHLIVHPVGDVEQQVQRLAEHVLDPVRAAVAA